MVDRLEMPNQFARLCIQRNDAVCEEVVAQPVATIEVPRGGAGTYKNQPVFLIDRSAPPGVCGAMVLPGAILPGLVSKFTRTRNRAESPDLFAASDVEGADIAGRLEPGPLAAGQSKNDRILV